MCDGLGNGGSAKELNFYNNDNGIQAVEHKYIYGCGFSPPRIEDLPVLKLCKEDFQRKGEVENRVGSSTVGFPVATTNHPRISPKHGEALPSSIGLVTSPHNPVQMVPTQKEALSSISSLVASPRQPERTSPIHDKELPTSSGLVISPHQLVRMSPTQREALSSISSLVAPPHQPERMSPTHGIALLSNSGLVMSPEQPLQLLSAQNEMVTQSTGQSFVEIIEEPTPIVKFRYISENRAEPIHGIRSTMGQSTCPSIRIHNHVGPALIVVSCVTADPPFKVHPHGLFLRNDTTYSTSVVVFEKKVTWTNNRKQLKIKIQCKRRCDVKLAIENRKLERVPQLSTLEIDPFGHGFEFSEEEEKSIDLNRVRLAIQVFVRKNNEEPWYGLKPITSQVISKSPEPSGALNIKCASHDSGPVSGNTKMIVLLSEMVKPNDMEMVFYKKNDQDVIWMSVATIERFYKENIAIVAKTPPYTGLRLHERLADGAIKAWFYLRKISNNEDCSRSLPFFYIPEERPSPSHPKPKRVRVCRSLPEGAKEASARKATQGEANGADDSDKALTDTLAHLSIRS